MSESEDKEDNKVLTKEEDLLEEKSDLPPLKESESSLVRQTTVSPSKKDSLSKPRATTFIACFNLNVPGIEDYVVYIDLIMLVNSVEKARISDQININNMFNEGGEQVQFHLRIKLEYLDDFIRNRHLNPTTVQKVYPQTVVIRLGKGATIRLVSTNLGFTYVKSYLRQLLYNSVALRKMSYKITISCTYQSKELETASSSVKGKGKKVSKKQEKASRLAVSIKIENRELIKVELGTRPQVNVHETITLSSNPINNKKEEEEISITPVKLATKSTTNKIVKQLHKKIAKSNSVTKIKRQLFQIHRYTVANYSYSRLGSCYIL